jgi:hypothetical protein
VAFLLPRVLHKHNLLGNVRNNRIHPNTSGEPNPAEPTISADRWEWAHPVISCDLGVGGAFGESFQQ